jgi:GAF domain-containing protein
VDGQSWAADVLEACVALVDTLVDDFDLADMLDRVTRTSVRLLGATGAGLLLRDSDGELQLGAASSQAAHLLEIVQMQRDGPCRDCVASGEAVVADDLSAHADRWPHFLDTAARVGYQSVHAVPLRHRDQVIGALGMFGSGTPALAAGRERFAQPLADAATIGILHHQSNNASARLAEQLQTALDSRVLIEQAKGALAQHGGLDMESAYRALRRYARDNNQRLTALAEALVRRQVDPDDVLAAATRPRPTATRTIAG